MTRFLVQVPCLTNGKHIHVDRSLQEKYYAYDGAYGDFYKCHYGFVLENVDRKK